MPCYWSYLRIEEWGQRLCANRTLPSRPTPAGLQPQEGDLSCGTVSGQYLYSGRFFGPHHPFRVEFSDALLRKTHFLEYLPRVLAQ
jgi:hypothetical protein